MVEELALILDDLRWTDNIAELGLGWIFLQRCSLFIAVIGGKILSPAVVLAY